MPDFETLRIEEIAIAMVQVKFAFDAWPDLAEATREHHRKMARAAFETMRPYLAEPSNVIAFDPGAF